MSEQLRFEDEDIPITLRRAWDRALRMLATRVNKPTFEAHIRTLRPLELTEGEGDDTRPLYTVTLGVQTAFTREWVEKRHAPTIQSLLEEILDRDVRIRFTLMAREAARPTSTSTPTLFEAPAQTPTPRKKESDAPALTLTPVPHRLSEPPRNAPDAPELNPRYTFNNFVTGPTNRLAHSGAIAVAQSPGNVYNPLFLYGPPGLGKTHLMHAIGNQLKEAQPEARVAYVSAEAFTSSFQVSLREKRTEAFRRSWRGIDIFLVDDIQFLAGKEYTREEFFHVFNEMYQMGKQIVICADRSPRELRAMDERLRSRFESGLIADIAPPDLETRLAILHKKAEAEGMRIPDEVLLYMARLVQSNIRTLEGALVKLIAYASLVNSPVTTQLAADILERYYIQAGIGAGLPGMPEQPSGEAPSLSMMASGLRGQITPELIQRIVARRFNMSVETLTGKRRDRETALARQIAMHLARELTELSLPGIGQVFGGKDHTTVMHACERIKTKMPLDDDLDTLVRELATQIRAQALQ